MKWVHVYGRVRDDAASRAGWSQWKSHFYVAVLSWWPTLIRSTTQTPHGDHFASSPLGAELEAADADLQRAHSDGCVCHPGKVAHLACWVKWVRKLGGGSDRPWTTLERGDASTLFMAGAGLFIKSEADGEGRYYLHATYCQNGS